MPVAAQLLRLVDCTSTSERYQLLFGKHVGSGIIFAVLALGTKASENMGTVGLIRLWQERPIWVRDDEILNLWFFLGLVGFGLLIFDASSLQRIGDEKLTQWFRDAAKLAQDLEHRSCN